jgi:hypothetical protein
MSLLYSSKKNTYLNWKFWNTTSLKVVNVFEMYNCYIFFLHQKLYDKLWKHFTVGREIFPSSEKTVGKLQFGRGILPWPTFKLTANDYFAVSPYFSMSFRQGRWQNDILPWGWQCKNSRKKSCGHGIFLVSGSVAVEQISFS